MVDSIVVDRVVKEYGSFRALDGVSLNIPRGKVFGLLGPNGAGKTTLLSIMTTLKRATSGSVMVEGFDIEKDKFSIRELQGIVFQDPSHDDELTAFENLLFHSKLYGVSKSVAIRKIDEVLELVGLLDRKNDFAHTFSGGMRRRMEIARALVHEPKILYLDEPTTGLDPQTRNHLWEYLKKLKGKTTIVLTTHYMEEAEQLCDTIAIIDHGKIIAEGTSEELKQLLGGDVIIVKSPDNVISALKGSKLRVDKHGGLFEIRVKTAEKELMSIIKLLKSKKVRVDSVSLHKVTLEDVFLHVTGKSLREESAVDNETKGFHLMGRAN